MQDGQIDRDRLPEWVQGRIESQDGPTGDVSPSEAVAPPADREEFVRVLERFGHRVRAVAKHYGRDRRQIYRWMDRFGVKREQGL